MIDKKNIAIIGSGISGLTLANFIKNNNELSISIFEKKNLVVEECNGIQISNNARRILNLLNFNKISKNSFCNISQLNILDCENEKKITHLDMNYFNQINEEYVCLDRGVLIKFLLEQVLGSVKFETRKVTSIVKGKKNSIIFENGERREFDIIVIADGVFSKLRKILDTSFLKQNFAIAYRGIVTNPNGYDLDKVNLLLGKNKHLVLYPINHYGDFSFTGISKEPKKLIKEIYETACTDQDISSFLNSFSLNIKSIILKSKKINKWPIYSHKNFFFGIDNIFVIGDAAHAMLPFQAQGAAQSIEDAYFLSKLIKDKNFSSKELAKIRYKRIEMIKKKSENNLNIFHLKNFFLEKFRNFFINIVFKNKKLSKLFLGKIFDFKI